MQPKKKQTLTSIAYEIIYRKIITLEYEPGQNLEEAQLVRELELGRTPIREALVRLKAEMLVDAEPQKGFIVRPITLQNTRAVFEALHHLELTVSKLAMQHQYDQQIDLMKQANKNVQTAIDKYDLLQLVEANHAFHVNFAKCSKNPYIVKTLREVRCESDRLAYLSFGFKKDKGQALKKHYENVIAQHQQIIFCLGEKEESRLTRIVTQHIREFKERISRYMLSI